MDGELTSDGPPECEMDEINSWEGKLPERVVKNRRSININGRELVMQVEGDAQVITGQPNRLPLNLTKKRKSGRRSFFPYMAATFKCQAESSVVRKKAGGCRKLSGAE